MKFGAYIIFLEATRIGLVCCKSSYSTDLNLIKPWTASESQNKYVLSPSILAADFARLGDEVRNALTAGADTIHIDVMDGHFVPGLSFGPVACKALRDFGVSKDMDVHLMTRPVDPLIKQFASAGASYITVHPEASDDVGASLALIRSLGCKAGLAISPDTSVDLCRNLMQQLDLILVMGVQPGKGGQPFIRDVLPKVAEVRRLISESGRSIRLSVDGGVKAHNIREIALAGADTFVVGSALLKEPRTLCNYNASIQELRDILEGL